MVALVKRPLRPVLWLLVIAQLLLSAPVVNAMAALHPAGSAATDCATGMADTRHARECPCCPDGVGTLASCLASCSATVGALPSFELPRSSPQVAAPASTIAVNDSIVDDPPLKPPPIR